MRRKECEHICNDGTDCRNFAASQGQGESFTPLVLGHALVLTGVATFRVIGKPQVIVVPALLDGFVRSV
jgi:hypothetical protein